MQKYITLIRKNIILQNGVNWKMSDVFIISLKSMKWNLNQNESIQRWNLYIKKFH